MVLTAAGAVAVVDYTHLAEQLEKHEGFREKPYRCTSGKLTIGIGRNIEDNGITYSEAMHLLSNDICAIGEDIQRWLPWVHDLDDTRQRVVYDMAFNMGINRLLKFRKMLAALKARDYKTASVEMMDSRWARQVKTRAETLSKMMEDG